MNLGSVRHGEPLARTHNDANFIGLNSLFRSSTGPTCLTGKAPILSGCFRSGSKQAASSPIIGIIECSSVDRKYAGRSTTPRLRGEVETRGPCTALQEKS